MAASEPAGPPRKELSAFFVVVNGQVESGEFPDDDLYVRYGFSFGPDWTVVDGIETGLSQIARKAPGVDQSVVWNFPVDISFKSTNAHGWPRMSISVYGVDGLGRDVVRGYGSVLIPPFPGGYDRYIHTYVPVPSSLWQRFVSWFTGTYAEFYDSKFVAQGENREVTRVESTGVVKVKFDVLTRGMETLGYQPAHRQVTH
ncbi:hypothetical protein AURANDRAFT_28991 [Aureococcus anophagefferens]|jgi:B9 domain-containing protein 1|uniref:B9 domain-containing protein 1 n=2 Tax=Aureococcus anophagefferens TaxID=44056 RepID=F0YE40_AURAN|nr:hypothetical protein AURANDRAFT_28991 [Aureococcus anophagefferens]EGB06642.1 hypothetical protein AURANDRAFT_28991 [Aureococcus anophagefferens]|eukprot:XP_009038814.1 hypothetical protein AURANDRAFT_28991 [Aureococcus anophagefferens]